MPNGSVGRVAGVLSLSLWSLAACTDGGTKAAADLAPAGTTVKVWVGTPTSRAFDAPIDPLPGATVAVTLPGDAGIVESTTGTDGSTTFVADFTKGSVTVTIGKADHVAVTALDVTPATIAAQLQASNFAHPGDMTFTTGPTAPPPPESFGLGGKITGKAATGNFMTLGVSTGGSAFQGKQSSYSLEVPAGKAYTLVGLEWSMPAMVARTVDQTFLKWFTIDRPAPTMAETLDLDVSAQTPVAADKIKTATVSVTVPGGAAGPLGGTSIAYGGVMSYPEFTFYGAPTKMAPNADGTAFVGEMQWIEVAPAADVIHHVYVNAQDGSFSQRFGTGYPPATIALTDMLGAPLTTVQRVTTGDSFEPFGLPTTRQQADLRLEVNDGGGGVYWVITARNDRIVVPKLPASIQSGFPGTTFKGNIVLIEQTTPGQPGLVRSRAFSRSLDVELL